MKRLRLRKFWVVMAILLLVLPLLNGSMEKSEAIAPTPTPTETTQTNDPSNTYTISFLVQDGNGNPIPDDGTSMPQFNLTPPQNSNTGFTLPSTARISAQLRINGVPATDVLDNYNNIKWTITINNQEVAVGGGTIDNDVMSIGVIENPYNMTEEEKKVTRVLDMTPKAAGILRFTFTITGDGKNGGTLNVTRNALITVPLQIYNESSGSFYNFTFVNPEQNTTILANNSRSSKVFWFYQDLKTGENVKLNLPEATDANMPITSNLIQAIGAGEQTNITTGSLGSNVYRYPVTSGKYGGFSRIVGRIYLNDDSRSDNYIEQTFDLFIKANGRYDVVNIEYGETKLFSEISNDIGNSLEWYVGTDSTAALPKVVEFINGGLIGKNWGQETLTLTPVPVFNKWENWNKINTDVLDTITFNTKFSILKGAAGAEVKADNYEVVDMGGFINLKTNVIAEGHTFHWQYLDGGQWRQIDKTDNDNQYLEFTEGINSGGTNSGITLKGIKAGNVTLRCVVTGNDINQSNGSTVSGSSFDASTYALTQTITIKVIDSLVLSDNYKTIPVGKSFDLTAESSITGDIIWTSANPDLVSIDPTTGATVKVTGVAVTDGMYIDVVATQTSTGRTAICKVKVVDAVSEVTIEGPDVLAQYATGDYKLVFAGGKPSYTKDQIKWVLKDKNGVAANTIVELIPNPTDYTKATVTGLQAGEVYLAVVTNDSFETEIAVITIKVVSKPSGLELSDENVVGYLPDQTYQLSYKILPENYVEEGLKVKWGTSDPSIATVDDNGLVTYHAVGKVIITATVEGVPEATDACYFDIQNPVESITLNPTSATIKVGMTTNITATITPDNVTDTSLKWESSNPNIATVDRLGVVTGISAGGTTITCTTSNGLTATCTVTVLQPAASITLNYENITVKKNTIFYLSAQILPVDAYDKTVTWTSSDEALATVSEDGTVTAIGVGVVTITATSVDNPELTAECIVTITEDVSGITLNAREKTIKVGEEFLLVPTIHPSDAQNRGVTFTSSDPTIASVDANGVIKGLKGGVVIITVKTAERGLMATCTITVQEDITGITLNETDIYLGKGANKQITYTLAPESATQRRLNWTSSDPSIVIVDSYGNIHGVNLGTAIITATSMDGTNIKATCKVTVVEQATSLKLNSTMIKLMEGEEFQLTYTILPPNTSIQKVKWSSSDASVARVDASGMVTALKEGECEIRATMTDGSDLYAVCTVIVTKANPITNITVNTTETTMVKGENRAFSARVVPRDTTESFTWVSSDISVVRIDGNGNATAVGPGTCTLTAVSNKGGVEGSCSVTVLGLTANSINLEQYDSYDLYLDGVPAGVTWFSRNKRVATVNNKGLVTARQPGTTTIVARMNGKLVSCEITVEKIAK